MAVINWRDAENHNVIGAVLYDNPQRTVHFMVRDENGEWVDRTTRPAPVRRLAESPPPEERQCLKTIQFVHHAIIPPGGRHVSELHIHPDAEELVVIMGGEGAYRQDGETQLVRQGDVIYVPPNAEHELRNTGEEMLMALFINVPIGEGLQALRD